VYFAETIMNGMRVEEQIEWARRTVLVAWAPERCVLEVTGSDRLTWLNGLLTCELAKRRVGEAVFGLAVAQKGKIVSDVVVLVDESRALLVVERASVATLTASFEHHLMMEDAVLEATVGDVAFVHGPRAHEALDAARASGAVGGELDVTGLGGAVIVTVGAQREALAHAAWAAAGGEADEEGWEVLRVLSAVPRFGVDFDETTYPQEAGLEAKAVSFQKGCYLGQEVVCMLEMRGHVKRKLVSLDVAGRVAPERHASVEDGNGGVVGEVTSAAEGPEGEVRALAMVKYASIASGTLLVVGGRVARVV
jgi:folate-binding protein YgfZ